MLSAAVVIVAGIVWLGVLFGIAVYGERRPRVLEKRWAIVYALSLAIHCTSWTFYGTVTQASRSGWWLPPTFVGAIALYVIGAGAADASGAPRARVQRRFAGRPDRRAAGTPFRAGGAGHGRDVAGDHSLYRAAVESRGDELRRCCVTGRCSARRHGRTVRCTWRC